MADTLYWQGEFVSAHQHLDAALRCYDPARHRATAFLYGEDAAVTCRSYLSHIQFFMGSLDQASITVQRAVTDATEMMHPHSRVFALTFSAAMHQHRREPQLARKRADESTPCRSGSTAFSSGKRLE